MPSLLSKTHLPDTIIGFLSIAITCRSNERPSIRIFCVVGDFVIFYLSLLGYKLAFYQTLLRYPYSLSINTCFYHKHLFIVFSSSSAFIFVISFFRYSFFALFILYCNGIRFFGVLGLWWPFLVSF